MIIYSTRATDQMNNYGMKQSCHINMTYLLIYNFFPVRIFKYSSSLEMKYYVTYNHTSTTQNVYWLPHWIK